jgi:DNA-binding transcriptional LysR family regulator
VQHTLTTVHRRGHGAERSALAFTPLLDTHDTRRGVEPTIYGEALLKRGLIAFDELKQGVREIQFLADPTAGELRIGCAD